MKESSGEVELPRSVPARRMALAPPAGPSRRRLMLSLALLPAVLLLLWGMWQPMERSADAMRYQWQLDPEEGFILDQAMRVAQGLTIYGPIDEYPYTVGNYPPVFQTVLGGTMLAIPPTLPLARGIVLLFLLGAVAAISHLVIRHTQDAVLAILAAGLFIVTWDLNNWIAFARVDIPALALGLTGLAVGLSMRGKRGLMLAALIFTVAFFTKQTQIVAPASLVAGLLWRRRINDAGLFCLVLAVCSALVFGLLTAFTSGRFFLHTVAWNVNVMEWPSLERWLNHLWFWGRFKLLALVLLGIGALVAGRLVKRPEGTGPADRGDVVLPALGFYLGLSFLSLFSLAKAGSAPNYLLEFHAAFALFAVFALDRVFGVLSQEAGAIAGRSRTVLKGIAGAAVLLLTLHAAENTLALGGGDGGEFLFGRGAYYQQGPSRADSELQAYVQLAVNDAPGDVLAEWPIFTILAGKPVLYQPFIMAQLAREGRWDQSEFVRELATADRFGLIVTRNDLSGDGPFPGFTEEMRTAILAHYELRATIGPWHLYYPVGSRARLREPMRA